MRVMFLIGHTADITYKKGILDKGMNFIAKPITPHLLLTKDREVLFRGQDEAPQGVPCNFREGCVKFNR